MRSITAALFAAAVLMFGVLVLDPLAATAQSAGAPEQNLAAAEPVAASTPASAEAAANAPPAYEGDGIAAIVNDQSISDYDLQQRVALFVATSSIQPSPDELKKIRGQILDQLETEKMELQEAVRKHITVSPVERDKRINALLNDNHITLAQLRATLEGAGVSMITLEAEITAQIAWEKTVQDEYASRVNITPAEVDAELARYADGADKMHYHVSEIFFGVDNADQDAKILKDAQSVEDQLQLGAPFPTMARQFSQSPSAASGGDIGWVHDGQLAPELNAALQKITVGTISVPIRSVGGYYILALRERLEPLGTKIQQAPPQTENDDGSLPLARILLPLSDHSAQTVVDNAVKVATQLRQQINSCENLDKIPQEIHGAVYNDLGRMKLADLSDDIRDALVKIGPGEVTVPFQSGAGIELIVRCDKRVVTMTAYTLPSREQVEDQLFNDQVSTLARRYLRDLKRDANVEVR